MSVTVIQTFTQGPPGLQGPPGPPGAPGVPGVPTGTVDTITATPSSIAPTSATIYFNIPTAAAIALPVASTWKMNNPSGTLFLKDLSGAAATNNILINCVGGDQIDGKASFKIASSWGSFRLDVTPSNNWTFVG